MAAKKAIGNYNDLKNFKVNMNLFNQDYNNQNNNRNKLEGEGFNSMIFFWGINV